MRFSLRHNEQLAGRHMHGRVGIVGEACLAASFDDEME
jgi:hypothetical protein